MVVFSFLLYFSILQVVLVSRYNYFNEKILLKKQCTPPQKSACVWYLEDAKSTSVPWFLRAEIVPYAALWVPLCS